LQEDEKGFRCKITGKKVSVMLRPCLGKYETCSIYSTYHPRMKIIYKCLINSLALKDYETEELISKLQSAKMPWEAKSCSECACFSEKYKACLFDLMNHKRCRCPVKELLGNYRKR